MVIDQKLVIIIRLVVLTAVELREKSYIQGKNMFSPGVYGLTMEKACLESCKTHHVHHTLAPLIWLALSEFFNDVQAWAEGEYDSLFDENGNWVDMVEPKTTTEAETAVE